MRSLNCGFLPIRHYGTKILGFVVDVVNEQTSQLCFCRCPENITRAPLSVLTTTILAIATASLSLEPTGEAFEFLASVSHLPIHPLSLFPVVYTLQTTPVIEYYSCYRFPYFSASPCCFKSTGLVNPFIIILYASTSPNSLLSCSSSFRFFSFTFSANSLVRLSKLTVSVFFFST